MSVIFTAPQVKPIKFYIDASLGSIVPEASTVLYATIPLNTRYDYLTSAITTPNGDTLDNYHIQEMILEYYYSSDGKWHAPGRIFQVSGLNIGSEVNLFGNANRISIQTASSQLWSTSVSCGGSNAVSTGNTTARYFRLLITAQRF